MNLPEIPQSYMAAAFLVSMVILRAFGIDSFTSAGLAAVSGYLFGREVERRSI